MKKNLLSLLILFLLSFNTIGQKGYEITINIKGAKDTLMYLVKYQWDQQYISDTCKKVVNGVAVFKGPGKLDRGVYTLVSQGKSTYFDFFINENQKFTINSKEGNIVDNLKSVGNKENEQFFSYIKYITAKNQDFQKIREQAKGKTKSDSADFVDAKLKTLNKEVKTFEEDFMKKNKGTFLYDVLNLKTEKELKDIPKASNGRPDSIYQYYWYKQHFFDGVNFKDERIARTPFFDDRIKKYFDVVLLQHPDTIIAEIDNLLAKCNRDSVIYNSLIGYLTYKYEQSKIMGFDKVFVHIADNYILPGKAPKVYTAETVKMIKDRVDILRNLLLDAKVAELYMIDTTYGRQVLKMGFDTAKSSKSLTDLYYKNVDKLNPMFKTLHSVNAKYTVLVFWASDCGHCQTEIPKLHENLQALKGKIDFKVFSVQTKEDFETWRKFIIKHKLDFINVFDPIHLNDLKVRFDIYSTPVIYILDKDKKIKAKRLSSEQVPEMLNFLDSIEKSGAK
jgi:thiol-disulfide isomerase/thioredoxin